MHTSEEVPVLGPQALRGRDRGGVRLRRGAACLVLLHLRGTMELVWECEKKLGQTRWGDKAKTADRYRGASSCSPLLPFRLADQTGYELPKQKCGSQHPNSHVPQPSVVWGRNNIA